MRRARAEGLDNVQPCLGDARELPYPPATFDAAYLVTVLGEIPDQEAALRQLRRVLRPGGRLVVGELFVDPHMVTEGALRRRGEAAGPAVRAARRPAARLLRGAAGVKSVGCRAVILLGVDVGTSGTRALAVTTDGELVAEANAPARAADPAAGLDRAAAGRVVAGREGGAGRGGRGGRRRDRRPRPHRPDARLGVPRRERRGDPPGAAVERPAHGGRVRRDHRARRRASGCSSWPAIPALTGFQAPKILWLRAPRAGRVRARGERAAAEGLRAARAHRRARDRRLGRLRHAAARRARARLVGRDPRRARDPARVAADASTRARR